MKGPATGGGAGRQSDAGSKLPDVPKEPTRKQLDAIAVRLAALIAKIGPAGDLHSARLAVELDEPVPVVRDVLDSYLVVGGKPVHKGEGRGGDWIAPPEAADVQAD